MSTQSPAALATDFQGPPEIHHMNSATAYRAAKLGMWLFLGTELLLFGVLFTSFAIFRYLYPQAFHEASHHLSIWAGTVNTFVLISSSFTAALAVSAAQRGQNDQVRKLILLTIGGACMFLVVKFFEYRSKFQHGLFPISYQDYGNVPLFIPALGLGALFLAFCGSLGVGFAAFHFRNYKRYYICIFLAAASIAVYALCANFFFENLALPADTHYRWADPSITSHYKMYFGLYFVMTGIHSIHVIIGMGILLWIYLLARRNRFSPEYYTPVEMGALYWHLVDLIWIYLFPLLYLID